MHMSAVHKLMFIIPLHVEGPQDVGFCGAETQVYNTRALLELIVPITQRYLFTFQKSSPPLQNPLRLKVAFSPHEGVSIQSSNDQRFVTLFDQFEKPFHAVALADAQAAKALHIKRVQPPQEIRIEASQKLGQDVVFLDLTSLLLWEQGMRTPTNVEFEVKTKFASASSGGLTTAPLRFPHLLWHILEKLQKNELPQDKQQVLIVGPGMNEGKRIPECPQWVELRSLMPQAVYELWDIDPKLLSYVEKMVQSRLTAYNSYRLNALTNLTTNEGLSDPIVATLEKVKQGLATHSVYKQEDCQFLRVDPEKIKARNFNIVTSQMVPEDKARFDLIVATMSITIALEQVNELSPVPLITKLAQFMELLKPGGSLYIESRTLKALDSLSPGAFAIANEYIECLIGHRLNWEEIPLTVLNPQFVNDAVSIKHVYRDNPGFTLPTMNLYCISRTSEKVEVSPEIVASRRQKFEELFTKQKVV